MKESKFHALGLLKEDSQTRQAPAAAPAAKTARPPGKRQDPAYQQISAYVRRDLYDTIRRELIGQPRDFSDLLEDWMGDWLKRQPDTRG
jgi:hypothetical protein